MAKDYPKAIKWISGEIAELEETIKVRTAAGLTNYNFPAELETMKEVKELLIAAQKIQTDFFDRLEKVGAKIFQGEARKDGL